MSEGTLLEFPCDFPLKVMGRNNDDFRSIVLGIVQKHTGVVDVSRIEERPSRDGTYLGITVTVTATSKAQLDGLYMELTSCERVMVAL
jgi:putative lipoic acid-binding regulatory protein